MNFSGARTRSRSRSKLECKEEGFWDIFRRHSRKWDLLPSWIKAIAIVLVATGLLLLSYLLWTYFAEQSSPRARMDRFIVDADRTTQAYFNGSARVDRVFRYAGQVLLLRAQHSPVVFQVAAGDERSTTHFLQHFIKLLKRHGLWRNAMELTVPAPPDVPLTHMELEHRIYEHLDSYDPLEEDQPGRVLVLRGIDHLASTSPLVLQSISDPDSARHKNVLMVMTVTTPNSREGDNASASKESKCDQRISDYLLERWSPSLEADKILPILSRLSAIPLCLD